MVTINQIYRSESGRIFRITLCACEGDWATVGIDAADPANRRHTIHTEEMVIKGGRLVPRMLKVRGVASPVRVQNDALMDEIRRGVATLLTDAN